MDAIIKSLGEAIVIPEGYAKFLDLRRHYASVAENVRRNAAKTIGEDDFSEALKLSETYGEVDIRYGAWRWGSRFSQKWIDPVLEDALVKFREHKCYEIDAETLEDDYLDTTPVYDCFRKWAKEGGIISQIVEAENYREEERRRRVESAMERWSGGGFGGIKIAIKGAVSAYAMNYAEASAVGLINKFKRAKTQRDTIELAIRAFKQYQMELIVAIHETIINMAEAVAKAYNDLVCDGTRYETVWNCGNEKRTKALFTNLREGKIPECDRKAVALKILKSDPNDKAIYMWLYDNFPDERSNIDDIAKFFCVDIYLYNQRDE